MATTCKKLGWVAGPVKVGGNKGLEVYEAVAGKTGLALFEMTESSPGEAAAVMQNMEAAGNGKYKPGAIIELPFKPDARTNAALELYGVIEAALADKKIDIGEGLDILRKASALATGKDLLGEAFGGLVGSASGLLSAVAGNKAKPKAQ
jgi:hypothetical protein